MTKFKCLIILEILLILIGAAGSFQSKEIIIPQEETAQLLHDGVSLPAGIYTARVYYETEDYFVSSFDISLLEGSLYKSLLSNPVSMTAGVNFADCQFYLLQDTDTLTININANGSEALEIHGAEISQGPETSRILLFGTIILSSIINSLILLYQYNQKKPLSYASWAAVFIIPFTGLLSSLPLMVDYVIMGADLSYHLIRIEALAQSIIRGEFFQRLQSYWLAGHGYASTFFYCDTFLSIPALFRIIGFSMNTSYRMFVLVVNLLTAGISYISFSKCFHDKRIGILGCVLYTLSPYRIYNIYNRCAVGEYTAMIFLPLLAWGFYKIYTEDSNKQGYLWNWVLPTIGFSGIIQSHILSCEMAGGLVVFLCLLLWRKTFQKRTFITLSLVVINTILINCWFIIPLFDMMLADTYYFNFNSSASIQHRGIYPAHIFYTLQASGNSSHFAENGMLNTEPITLGLALFLCIGMWFFIRAKYPVQVLSDSQKTERTAADIAILLGTIILVMSTNLFPYDFISSRSKILGTLIGTLQFPTRLTAMATICMVTAACIMGKWVLSYKWELLSGKVYLTLLCCISILFASYQVNHILLTKDNIFRLYSAQNMGNSSILGAEYLPSEAVLSHLMYYHDPIVSSDAVALKEYQKDGLTINALIETSSSESALYIEFPLLYYKGFHAYETTSGMPLELVKGDNCDVRLLLDNNFSGRIQIEYTGMWYWHFAEFISIFSGCILSFIAFLSFIRKRHHKK